MRKVSARRALVIAASVFGAALLFLFVFVLTVNLVVVNRVKKHIVDAEEIDAEAGRFDCILVLGAGVLADGSPSHMLEDRLKVGVSLYFDGASDRLLMSGDHMTAYYDEVGTMKAYAVAMGVPDTAVFLDHAGLSTYESMYRARELYGAEKVLIVTQEYHLYRALYIAEEMGMEAYGVSADLRPYSGQIARDVREIVARVKDYIFARFKPQPTYMGDHVDLFGDGNSTNVNKLLPDGEVE